MTVSKLMYALFQRTQWDVPDCYGPGGVLDCGHVQHYSDWRHKPQSGKARLGLVLIKITANNIIVSYRSSSVQTLLHIMNVFQCSLCAKRLTTDKWQLHCLQQFQSKLIQESTMHGTTTVNNYFHEQVLVSNTFLCVPLRSAQPSLDSISIKSFPLRFHAQNHLTKMTLCHVLNVCQIMTWKEVFHYDSCSKSLLSYNEKCHHTRLVM